MKIKITEAALSGMIQKAVNKVLKEDMYDDYSEAGDNGDSSELSDFMNGVENDLNMQDKYDDGNYNKTIISTKELINIANKAGETVIDAKDALMDLAIIYDEDDVPMYRIEEILGEYDMTMDDINDIDSGDDLNGSDDDDEIFDHLSMTFNITQSKAVTDILTEIDSNFTIQNNGQYTKFKFATQEDYNDALMVLKEAYKNGRFKFNRFNESTNMNEGYNDYLALETYIDGQQMIGSDGTSFLHNTSPRAINNAVKTRINTIKGLSNIKPYIGKANNITLKLTNGDSHGNNKVLKEFDVTDYILASASTSVAESKKPTIIKTTLSEVRQLITQIIKEESERKFFDNFEGDAENNFEQPFNENDPQINEMLKESSNDNIKEILDNILTVIDGEYKMQGMLGNKGVFVNTDFGNLRFRIVNNSIYVICENDAEGEALMSSINNALGDVISAGIPSSGYDRSIVIITLVQDSFDGKI